jgi:hypothetical protein
LVGSGRSDERYFALPARNNHALPLVDLLLGSGISLDFETTMTKPTLTIRATSFRFTDPLIDCAFVVVEPSDQVGPLRPSNSLFITEYFNVRQRIWIAQHIGGAELAFETGGAFWVSTTCTK